MHVERDTILWNNVVQVHDDKSKSFKRCLYQVVSIDENKHNKWFMNDKDIVWKIGDSP